MTNIFKSYEFWIGFLFTWNVYLLIMRYQYRKRLMKMRDLIESEAWWKRD